MAIPRVFVSSTFYDLRQIRADLELFIREMGYEPVLHERGGLPFNNTIQGFETASDITAFLKLQWAGLFHRSLQDQARSREFKTLEELQTTVATLDRVVEFLTAERGGESQALNEILKTNHPAFARLRELLNVRYPVFFRTRSELNRWLIDGVNYRPLPREAWDDQEHREWQRGGSYLRVAESLFDDHGRLRPMTPEELGDDAIELLPLPAPQPRRRPILDEEVLFEPEDGPSEPAIVSETIDSNDDEPPRSPPRRRRSRPSDD
jgi:hypothetical protein